MHGREKSIMTLDFSLFIPATSSLPIFTRILHSGVPDFQICVSRPLEPTALGLSYPTSSLIGES